MPFSDYFRFSLSDTLSIFWLISSIFLSCACHWLLFAIFWLPLLLFHAMPFYALLIALMLLSWCFIIFDDCCCYYLYAADIFIYYLRCWLIFTFFALMLDAMPCWYFIFFWLFSRWCHCQRHYFFFISMFSLLPRYLPFSLLSLRLLSFDAFSSFAAAAIDLPPLFSLCRFSRAMLLLYADAHIYYDTSISRCCRWLFSFIFAWLFHDWWWYFHFSLFRRFHHWCHYFAITPLVAGYYY